MYWSCAGAGDLAELVDILSHDIMSVHWLRAAAHCDITKQHVRFFEKRENYAMHGALVTAATGA